MCAKTTMSVSSQNTHKIAKNTFMLYIRMLLTMLVALYTSRVVLEVLGVEDFGTYNVVGGIVTMFSFLNGTMAASTQRFLSYAIGKKDLQLLKNTFSLTVSIHCGVAILVLLLAETMGIWFLNTYMNIPQERMDAARWVYQFSIFSFVVSVIQVPYNAIIIAREQMNIYAYMSIVEVCLKLLVVFMLMWIGYDKLKLYAILIFSVTVVIALFYRIYCKCKFSECKYHFVFDKNMFYSLTSYAGWNLSANIALIARTQGVNILLNIFYGPTLNAARGIAVQVNTAIISFVTNFQMAVNPQIVKSYAQEYLDEMRKIIIKSSKFSFLLLFFGALPFIFETEFILNIWLKNIPTYGIVFCRLILICTLCDILSGTLGYGALATGKIRNYQMVMSLLFLMNLPVVFLFFKLGSAPQVIFYIEFFIYIIALFTRLILLKRMIDFPVFKYLTEVVGRSLLVAALSSIIPLVIFVTLNAGFIRFILVTIFSLGGNVIISYWIGLNGDERIWIKKQIINHICKLGIKDKRNEK